LILLKTGQKVYFNNPYNFSEAIKAVKYIFGNRSAVERSAHAASVVASHGIAPSPGYIYRHHVPYWLRHLFLRLLRHLWPHRLQGRRLHHRHHHHCCCPQRCQKRRIKKAGNYVSNVENTTITEDIITAGSVISNSYSYVWTLNE
jgi:hypothetical protein